MSWDPELVSVITPIFNSEKYIRDTIRSVQAQDYSNWEMLCLIDAGTKDRSAEIIQSVGDPRVKLVSTPNGRSVQDARNHGFQMARGRWIAFLDSDDLWLPGKLSRQLAEMRRTGAALSCTAYRRMNLAGTEEGRLLEVPSEITHYDLLAENTIGCLTVILDQEQTGTPHMPDEIHEDYVLWLGILKRGLKAIGINEDLARYRVVPSSRSSNKLKMARWRWNVFREKERMSWPTSAFHFLRYAWATSMKHGRF